MDARGGRRRDENRDVLAAGRYVEMSRQMSRRRLLKARTDERRQRDARLRCAVDPTAGGDPNGHPDPVRSLKFTSSPRQCRRCRQRCTPLPERACLAPACVTCHPDPSPLSTICSHSVYQSSA